MPKEIRKTLKSTLVRGLLVIHLQEPSDLERLTCLLVQTPHFSLLLLSKLMDSIFFCSILSEDQYQWQKEDTTPFEEDPASYDSDFVETDGIDDDNEEEEEETRQADLGTGWGRIIFTPLRRGKQIALDICRATNREGTQGSFERVVITQSENPKLHLQARRSLWGDLWPF